MGWRRRKRSVSLCYCVKCQIVGITRLSWGDPCGTRCLRTGHSIRSRTASRWRGTSLRIWPRPARTPAPPPVATPPPPPTLPPRPRSRILSRELTITTWASGRPRPPPRRSASRPTRGRGPPPGTCRASRPAASSCPGVEAPEPALGTGVTWASARGWTWSTTKWRTTAPPTGTSGATESRATSPAPAWRRLPPQWRRWRSLRRGRAARRCSSSYPTEIWTF